MCLLQSFNIFGVVTVKIMITFIIEVIVGFNDVLDYPALETVPKFFVMNMNWGHAEWFQA